MGIYINKGNEGFRCALNGAYVDKTGMIEIINKTLDTERRFTCVTRSRRFGKSMAVDMLCAYYDNSSDSRTLFDGLAAQKGETFEKHLNQYPVISLDITDFITRYRQDADIVHCIQHNIMKELNEVYPDVKCEEGDDLMEFLIRIQQHKDEKFIVLIDEWDAICREFSDDPSVMDEYVKLLRRLFKGGKSKDVFAGAYMTGILPIKKYKTQSALNNFEEYSVVNPGKLASFFGFTPEEVRTLAQGGEVTAEELRLWYDGYQIGKEPSIYNPYSVIRAIANEECNSYWSATSTYDNVVTYIQMNYDGLKDDVIKMLAGGRCKVNTTRFQNDLSVINSKDDIFTVLIHLGYLSYDKGKGECYIPNNEVRMEMTNAVEDTGWKRLTDALVASEKLLEDTLEGNEEAVARGIELTHDSNTSILSYNDENSLACALTIAYYHAMNDYVIHRELATGRGFADLVFIPRRNVDKPAMVVELKYNKDCVAAIEQIRQKNYPAKVAEYLESDGSGGILLVGINYDKETKAHTCKIEKYVR
ncbi:MAG: AAA family ATPase [Bacteroidales bacterium]|nr:AAA family ATPase [Candidatus Physcousia equi]